MVKEYKNPSLTVDIVMTGADREQICLIERVNEPYGWALPGGFVDVGEKTIDAAIREALEETGCRLTNVKQFHAYSNPKRDPRQHVVSIVYIAETLDIPIAADDAKNIGIFNIKRLEACKIGTVHDSNIISNNDLCFDHSQIILDVIRYFETGERPTQE